MSQCQFETSISIWYNENCVMSFAQTSCEQEAHATCCKALFDVALKNPHQQSFFCMSKGKAMNRSGLKTSTTCGA